MVSFFETDQIIFFSEHAEQVKLFVSMVTKVN